MVELLEQNSSLAQGFSRGINKINVKDEWNKIATKLNAIGPPVRTGEAWMKVWADFKFKLKKKLVHNKAESHATGGGSFNQHVLSATEVAAVNLLQLDKIVNPEGQAFGINCSIQMESELIEDDGIICENRENIDYESGPTIISTKNNTENKKKAEKKENTDFHYETSTSILTNKNTEKKGSLEKKFC